MRHPFSRRPRIATLLACLALACASLSCSLPGARPAPSEPELLRQPYFSATTGKQRHYLLYLPRGYRDDPDRRWPVILFLHGSGEVGDGAADLDRVLVHGPLAEAWIQQRDLPFIMIGPQLPLFGQTHRLQFNQGKPMPQRTAGAPPPRPPADRPTAPISRDPRPADALFEAGSAPPESWWKVADEVLEMLDEVLADFQADPDRVYLTGFSLGGYGTFSLAAARPRGFAAIAPICGAGAGDNAEVIASHNIPTWVITGGRDPAIPVEHVTDTVQTMNSAGHTALRYTVHEHAGHLVWIEVYAGQDIYDWMLQQRLER